MSSELRNRRQSGRDGIEPEMIVTATCDVLSPNELGTILNGDAVPRLHACVMAGAAASRRGTKAAV
jgi:hypothetical protein